MSRYDAVVPGPAHPPAEPGCPEPVEAVPVQAAVVGPARPAAMAHVSAGTGGAQHQPRRGSDKMAVASAICGFSAIVPVVSQVLGLALGIASLVRIRRARLRGVVLPGTGWAVTGICVSGLALLVWVVVFAVLATVGSSLTHTTDVLGGLAPPGG